METGKVYRLRRERGTVRNNSIPSTDFAIPLIRRPRCARNLKNSGDKPLFSELLIAGGIVTICVVIHIIGIVVLFQWLLRKRELLPEAIRLGHTVYILIVVFGIIVLLHLAETAIWAFFYFVRDLFPDFETSLYFSLTCYSTVGFGDVVLPKTWRLLGGIEAISGALLCGLSTAFIFVILTALLQIRRERREKSKERSK
jgi:hypothetical protein